MVGDRLVETLYAVEAVASASLVVRFLFAGLYQVYRFFFVYLIVFCIQVIGQFFIRPRTDAYALFFFATEGTIVCLYAFVTLELYSLILREARGIATVARQYIRIAIAVAILFSVLLLGLEQTPKSYISSFFSFERPIVSSLIFFVLLITAFLIYYPVPLNRNVINYTIGYAIYFASKAILLLFNNTGQYWKWMLSMVMLSVSTACLIFWLFALTRAGETKQKTAGPAWEKGDRERMLNKLAEINANLLRQRKGMAQSQSE
jgi:hypothetical protein